MIKLTDYRKINHLVDRIRMEKVYPLSILEGIQTGEIFVDDDEALIRGIRVKSDGDL